MLRVNTHSTPVPPTTNWIEIAHNIKPPIKAPRTFFSTPTNDLHPEYLGLSDLPRIITKMLWRLFYEFHVPTSSRQFLNFKEWDKERVFDYLSKEGFEAEASAIKEYDLTGRSLYYLQKGDLDFIKDKSRQAKVEDAISKVADVSRVPKNALKGKISPAEADILFDAISKINHYTISNPYDVNLGSVCFILKFYLHTADFMFDSVQIEEYLKHFMNQNEQDIIQGKVANTFDILMCSQSYIGKQLLNNYFSFFSHLVTCPFSFCYGKPLLLARAFAPSIFKHSLNNKNDTMIARRAFLGALFFFIRKKYDLVDHPYNYKKVSLWGEIILAFLPDITSISVHGQRVLGNLYFTNGRIVWVAQNLEIPERDEIHIPIASITSFKEAKEPKSNAIRVELIVKFFIFRRFVFPNMQICSQFSSLLIDSFKQPLFFNKKQYGKDFHAFGEDVYHPVKNAIYQLPDPFVYHKLLSSNSLGNLFPPNAITHHKTVDSNFSHFFPILVLQNANIGCFMRTNTIYPTLYKKVLSAVVSGAQGSASTSAAPGSDPFLNLVNAFAHRSKESAKSESTWTVPCDSQIPLVNHFLDATIIEVTETTQQNPSEGLKEHLTISSPATITKKFSKLVNVLTLKEIRGENEDIMGMIDKVSATWRGEVESVIRVVGRIAEKIVTCERVILYTPTTEMNPIQCLLSSLVCVLLCPSFRTLKGLCYLIENEWIQHGCVFYSRFGQNRYYFSNLANGVKNMKANSDREIYCCLFTLFLDCLWQLLTLFPSCFEFSTYTLLNLHEILYNAEFDTFTFDGSDFSKFMSQRSLICSLHMETQVHKNVMFKMEPIHSEPLNYHCTIKVDILEKLSTFQTSYFFSQLYCEAFGLEQIQMYTDALGIKDTDLYPYRIALTNTKFLAKDDITDSKFREIEEYGIYLRNSLPLPISCSLKETESDFIFVPDNSVLKKRLSSDVISAQKSRSLKLPSAKLLYFPPIATPLNALTDVTELILSDNNLTMFPAFLLQMGNLVKLDLSKNMFHHVSPEAAQLFGEKLQCLTSLNLSSTNISVIPPGFEKLHLQELDLSGNHIQSIRNLSNIMELHTLRLQNCGLQHFPKALAALPSLTHLDLSVNKCSTIDSEVFLSMMKLNHLNLSSNPLTTQELAKLASLSNLTQLYLLNTEMTSYPFQLGTKLTQLTTLDISKNKKLTAISNTIYLCENLQAFTFNDTPLLKEEGIPHTIILLQNTNIRANLNIKQYIDNLKSAKHSESVKKSDSSKKKSKLKQLAFIPTQWRAKIAIIGREKVGKTALAQCISQAKKIKKKSALASTNGCDIFTWRPFGEKEKEKDLIVSLWDYAAQQTQEAFHHLVGVCPFRILVWDATESFESTRLDTWLEEIASQNQPTTVFLVATHIDLPSVKSANITKVTNEIVPQFNKKFPKMALKSFQLSCTTLAGFNEFNEALLNEVGSFAEEMTINGALLEREIPLVLESLGTAPPIISFSDWELLAKGCLIKSDKSLKEETKRLARMGVIYHYDFPEIRDFVMFNPDYLPKLISSLVSDNHGWISKGQLKVADLGHLWKGINPSLYPQLLKVLYSFKVMFLLSDRNKGTKQSLGSLSQNDIAKQIVLTILQTICTESNSDLGFLLFYDDSNDKSPTQILLSTQKNTDTFYHSILDDCVNSKSNVFVNNATETANMYPNAYRIGLLYGGQIDDGHYIIVIMQTIPIPKLYTREMGIAIHSTLSNYQAEIHRFVSQRSHYVGNESIEQADVIYTEEADEEEESEHPEILRIVGAESSDENESENNEHGEIENEKDTAVDSFIGYVENSGFDNVEQFQQNQDEDSDVEYEDDDESSFAPKLENTNGDSETEFQLKKKLKLRTQKYITKKENLMFKPNDIIFIPSLSPETPQKSLDEIWPPLKTEELQFKKVYKFSFVPYGLFSTICGTFAQRYSCLHFWKTGIVFELSDNPLRPRVYLSLDRETKVIGCLIRFINDANAISVVASLFEPIEEQLCLIFTHLFSLRWETFYACNVCLPALDSPLFAETTIANALRTKTQIACSKHQKPIDPSLVAPDLFDFTANTKDRLIPFKQIKVGEAIVVGTAVTVCRGVWKQPLEEVSISREKTENRSGLFSNSKTIDESGKKYRETIVGIKMFNTSDDSDSTQTDLSVQCRREIKTLNQFNHPNLMKFYGFTNDPLMLVIDFVEGNTSLYDIVGEKSSLQMPQILNVATEICSAMEYLHSNKPIFLHRNLKSTNVLVKSIMAKNKKFTIVLSDFGKSGEVSTHTEDGAENSIWSAPEVISKGLYTTKSDVYAFGVILWELISPTRFFKGYFINEISQKIVSGERPEIVSNLKKYSHLVNSCWSPEPQERPPFVEISQYLKNTILPEASQET